MSWVGPYDKQMLTIIELQSSGFVVQIDRMIAMDLGTVICASAT